MNLRFERLIPSFCSPTYTYICLTHSDELIRLRGDKPLAGERRSSDSIPIPSVKPVQRILAAKTPAPPKEEEMKDVAQEAKPDAPPEEAAVDDSDAAKTTDDTSGDTAASTAEKPKEEDDEASEEDSTAVAGKDEATELDADLDGTNGEDDDLLEDLPSNTQFMLSNLIESIEGDSGQVVAKLSSEGEGRNAIPHYYRHSLTHTLIIFFYRQISRIDRERPQVSRA